MRKNTRYLRARWSKKEDALLYGGVSKQDGGLLSFFFETYEWPDKSTLAGELEKRGYDLKTLQFSIKKKEPKP